MQPRHPPRTFEDGARLLPQQFALPEVVVQKLGAVELRAKIDCGNRPATSHTRSGQQMYSQPVPAGVLKGNVARVELELDKFFPAGSLEDRELGVIAVAIAFEPF